MALVIRTVSAMAQPPGEGVHRSNTAGPARASLRRRHRGLASSGACPASCGPSTSASWSTARRTTSRSACAAPAPQERLRAARQAGAIPDTLLLLEHEPVYTRGRRSAAGELGMGEDWYRARGIDIVDVDRGGKVTYHGPGQLVGYPIVGVGDV